MQDLKKGILVLWCVAMAALSFGGCSGKVADKVAEKAIEKMASSGDAKVDIDSANKSMTISTKDGTTTMTSDESGQALTMTQGGNSVKMVSGEAAKIPDDFPKDVPLYTNANLVMVNSSTEDHMFSVQAKTADPVDKVAEHFKKEAVAQGWTEGMVMSVPGEQSTQMLNYTKGERQLSVTITRQDSDTMILLTTADK